MIRKDSFKDIVKKKLSNSNRHSFDNAWYLNSEVELIKKSKESKPSFMAQ